MLSLPPELEDAITETLRAVPSSQWMSAARHLSERYRADRDAQKASKPLASGLKEVLGYAGLVMPAAYAQLAGAMSATVERARAFAPGTMLDLGSGPGTALWAAAEHWPSLRIMHAWEREAAFIDLGKRLARSTGHDAVKQAAWRQVSLEGTLPASTPSYDLIVIGHVLNEMPEALQRALVQSAWEHCSGVLLIVEPGTSAAFPVVRAARDQLLAAGAHTLAPCAHDNPCPLQNDWCHFPQKLHRPEFQQRVKEGTAGWEEAKFSYAAMARFPQGDPIWGRLIHQPQVSKAGVELIVSSREGIARPRIPKRDHARYRPAVDLHWGDSIKDRID